VTHPGPTPAEPPAQPAPAHLDWLETGYPTPPPQPETTTEQQ
jgi:hypothetical protein